MQSRFRARAGAKQRAAGFTLIEVLISMLLIAIGVLGTAGLQALSYKMNQGGQLRGQAVVLGLDFIERVEANNAAAIVGGYAPTTYPTAAATDCSTTFCTPAQLATYDLVVFKAIVLAQLPAAAVTVTMTGTGPFEYKVIISWQERITKGSGTTVATTGTTSVATDGKTETFSYSITRMFQNRSLII